MTQALNLLTYDEFSAQHSTGLEDLDAEIQKTSRLRYDLYVIDTVIAHAIERRIFSAHILMSVERLFPNKAAAKDFTDQTFTIHDQEATLKGVVFQLDVLIQRARRAAQQAEIATTVPNQTDLD